MPDFNYTDQIHSFEVLEQALIAESVLDAYITIHDGNTLISTDAGNQSQVDNAVSNSHPDSLLSKKTDRINEVKQKTDDLLDLGIDDWNGKKVLINKLLANQYYTDHLYFINNPGDISATKPYIVMRIDGRSSSTANIANVGTLVANAVQRIQEIYVLDNGVDPKGQDAIIQEIVIAPDEATLDAIVDNRS